MTTSLTGEIIKFAALVTEGIIEYPAKSSVNSQLNSNGIGLGTSIFQCMEFILNFTSSPFIFVDNFHHETISNSSNLPPNYNNNSGSNITNLTALKKDNIQSASHLFQTGQIDVAFGFFYFLPARSIEADALTPISDERFRVYFLQPQFTQFDNPFNRQFSSDLVYAYLIILLTSSFILMCSTRTLGTKPIFTEFLYDTVMWVVGTWCQHGSSLNTFGKWQSKLIINLVSFLSFLLYSMYCAVIIATLANNMAPIRQMEHLFLYQYTFFAFSDTKDILLSGIERFWSPPPPPSSLEMESLETYEKSLSILRLSSNHRHAHLDTDDIFYPGLDIILASYFDGATSIKSRKICERLSTFPVKGGGFQSGFYVKKGFQFRNEFNYAVHKSRETGVFFRLKGNYESTRFQSVGCWDSIKRPTYQENLGMTFLGSMFTALAVASLISSMIFLVENVYFKILSRSK